MAKDPAVLFYTSDFISGTALMSYEEKGQYIHLLCLQHQLGHFTMDEIKNITNSEKVISKFELSEDGKYHNKRMHEEKLKRNAYCESRRKSVSKRYSKSTYVDTHVAHTYVRMENENDNDNSSSEGESLREGVKNSDWSRFCQAYPHNGSCVAPEAEKLFRQHLASGATADFLIKRAAEYRQYTIVAYGDSPHAKYVKQAKNWLLDRQFGVDWAERLREAKKDTNNVNISHNNESVKKTDVLLKKYEVNEDELPDESDYEALTKSLSKIKSSNLSFNF